jgi:phenylacetic acid degradation operon negative regulatory protein
MTKGFTDVNGSVGPPRSPRSPTTGLVATLFQLADRPELPGVALVELLGGLGLSPAAARQHLARMREDGQLAGRRAGRGTLYRLAGPFGRRVAQLGAEFGTPPPQWAGHFHALLFTVPERHRAYRDRLRRVALLVGYGLLQPGVLISVPDRSDQLAELLDQRPDDARITHATLAMDTAEAAAVASTAWDLPTVAGTFRGHADAIQALLREPGPVEPGPSTLRRYAELSNAVFIDLVDDPRLPAELRPPDWPFRRLLVAMGELRDRYDPPAREYMRRRLAETEKGRE